MLKEITNEKHIGVNALRSAYVSKYFNNLDKLQLERIAFLMRSSVSTLQNHYLKNDGVGDEPEPDGPTPEPEQTIKNKVIKPKMDIKPLIKTEEVKIKNIMLTHEEKQQYN
jgi:hypothetical protein